MLDFITSILDAQIDYVTLLTGVFVYIAVMWVMFCIWVFLDARKKFNSILVAVLFTLFVLPLNIPGFILYLIVRPEHEDWADVSVVDAAGQAHHYGGVHVPVVHFTGEEGDVQMTFGLTINPKTVSHSPDMNIDVSFDAKRSDLNLKSTNAMELNTGSAKTEMPSNDDSEVVNIGKKLKEAFSNLGSTVSGSLGSSTSQLRSQEEPVQAEVEVQELKIESDEVSSIEQDDSNEELKVEETETKEAVETDSSEDASKTEETEDKKEKPKKKKKSGKKKSKKK